MFAAHRPSRSAVNLDEFLAKLKEALTQCSDAIRSASEAVPHWAASCTNLLYSHKSIPLDFNEPGKLYISYKADDPLTVDLLGKSKEKKPINRKLKIVPKAGNMIAIVSDHIDLRTGKSFSCVGIGKTFKAALDQYFSCSDLKKSNHTYNTDSNIQKNGDAFLLPQVINSKGNDWVTEIVNTVSKIIPLLPSDKHPEVLRSIEKNIKDFDKFLNARENAKIVKQYDPRLWIIVETVCKHVDPLEASGEHPKRKDLRDYFIAECCSKVAKGEDIIPRLSGYLDAMQMHLEIHEACQRDDPEGRLQKLMDEYRRNNLFPEKEEHRERIREYHGKCKGPKNEEASPQVKPH